MAQILTGHYIYRHSKYQKIGKAASCKITRRVSAESVLSAERDTYMIRGFVCRVCECGGYATGQRVNGKLSEQKCDARCLGATGVVCECSCSGENHGANY